MLVRAGYIRRAAPGIYSWLPLGYRVYRKIEQIVREEMDAIGAQEVGYAALAPLVGLPPEIGLALSLLKRARDLAIGVPALLVWQWSETRQGPPVRGLTGDG